MREASLGQDRTAARHIVNGLSVDVEEYFQVGAFENTIARGDWEGIASRVEHNTGAVLDLFARCGVKATFFTLGWVAHRHPALIRRIIAEGHEIASHGWDHTRVFTMTPDQFGEDIDRARKALEDAGGVAIKGYRAPSFSIDQRTPWAHEILAERGYAYSSSVAPIAHDHYGWREAPRFAFHPVDGASLIELPVTTVQLGERRFGAGGGGFFRILPYTLSRWALRRVNQADMQPAIFYFHPWEIDADQPRVEGAPMRSRLRHYTGLGSMAGRLEQLTRDFSWCRIDEIALPLAARRL
ncbi:XrtA system polysaccharide deacetylase [Sphingomonas sp. 35-24ZXX]|uniref:XrtA system polysaccharide deacetylase n=1 Tax=Sphingomonas sp. 35-24ZXX TaxID=1545915 RepID=UPI0009DD8644|nr:XrtA system polysaccharide deacetylase [Sphingomonas sp. 35-24ZXX]